MDTAKCLNSPMAWSLTERSPKNIHSLQIRLCDSTKPALQMDNGKITRMTYLSRTSSSKIIISVVLSQSYLISINYNVLLSILLHRKHEYCLNNVVYARITTKEKIKLEPKKVKISKFKSFTEHLILFLFLILHLLLNLNFILHLPLSGYHELLK